MGCIKCMCMFAAHYMYQVRWHQSPDRRISGWHRYFPAQRPDIWEGSRGRAAGAACWLQPRGGSRAASGDSRGRNRAEACPRRGATADRRAGVSPSRPQSQLQGPTLEIADRISVKLFVMITGATPKNFAVAFIGWKVWKGESYPNRPSHLIIAFLVKVFL